MTGDAVMLYTTHKNGDFGHGLWHWLYHINGAGIASGNQTWLAGTVSISFDDQRKNLHLQGISQLRLITEEIFDGI